MKMVNALEYEQNRQTPEDYVKILLSKEGKFLRAYERSAWLLKNFCCTDEMQRQRGDAKPLSATHYKTSKSDYVMVGFPIESTSKFLMRYQTATTLDGGDIEATIESPFGDATVEQIEAAYQQWRSQCPEKESTQQQKPQRRDITAGAGREAALARSGVFHILSQVFGYPVENATPQQNYEFISSLKQQLAQLL